MEQEQIKKREWVASNSSTVASSATWFCMGESAMPSDLERDNYFPLKSLVFENLSGEPYDVILDPISATTGVKQFRVADGKTLIIESDEDITFYNVIAINKGSLTSAIGELRLTVRNY